MEGGQLRLLASRRLLPFFCVQFLGAVNDNLFKNALVILVAYRATQSSTATEIIVTIATALFILPYFLFSATAGQLADKYAKAGLVRIVKLWEVGVMVLAAAGFALANTAFLLGILFFLGVQATFFGPVKYGILPELLAPDELMAGNALVEAGTFLAILIGTIAGGLLILAPYGIVTVTATLLVFAVAGWAASLAIPRTASAAPGLRLSWNIATETWAILRHVQERRELLWPILGISWFWAVGVGYLAQFPNYAKDVLGANNEVVTLFLTLFSVGIGVGSMLCGKLQKGEINARLVPWGGFAMALFALDLSFAGAGARSDAPLVGVLSFLGVAGHWRIVFDLFAIALGGGIFVVPLYAIMQARSEEQQRARVVAANNVLNALSMVLCGAISALMLQLGSGVMGIFLALAIGNFIVAAASLRRR